jgi:hypothetical protein
MAFMLGQLAYKVLLNAAETTTVTGSSNDLAGWVEPGNSQCEAFLLSTARTYTGSPTVIVTIQEDDTSAFSAPTTVATFTTIATTAAVTEQKSAAISKRYVRTVATFSADTTTGSYTVLLVGSNRTV